MINRPERPNKYTPGVCPICEGEGLTFGHGRNDNGTFGEACNLCSGTGYAPRTPKYKRLQAAVDATQAEIKRLQPAALQEVSTKAGSVEARKAYDEALRLADIALEARNSYRQKETRKEITS